MRSAIRPQGGQLLAMNFRKESQKGRPASAAEFCEENETRIVTPFVGTADSAQAPVCRAGSLHSALLPADDSQAPLLPAPAAPASETGQSSCSEQDDSNKESRKSGQSALPETADKSGGKIRKDPNDLTLPVLVLIMMMLLVCLNAHAIDKMRSRALWYMDILTVELRKTNSAAEEVIKQTTLADHFQALHDYAKAAEHFQKAVDLARYTKVTGAKSYWNKMRLAKCFIHLGRFEEAEKQVTIALAEAGSEEIPDPWAIKYLKELAEQIKMRQAKVDEGMW